jgi:hypothetical protein
LPSIDSEEAPPVFGGGRGRVGLCGYGRGRAREREREGEWQRGEREGESDFIPNHTCSPENDGIPGFVWVWKRKGHGERELERQRRRERQRGSGGWRSSIAEGCEKYKNQLLLFSFYFIAPS